MGTYREMYVFRHVDMHCDKLVISSFHGWEFFPCIGRDVRGQCLKTLNCVCELDSLARRKISPLWQNKQQVKTCQLLAFIPSL